MRHHRHSIRFGRQRSHYMATLKHLVRGLLINKTITTTKVKAKEASRLADKLITLAKEKTIVNQRKAYSILGDRKLVAMLFNEIAPLFKERKGGYTRVILTVNRRGDNAEMAILEFVEKPKPPEPKKKEKKEKKAVEKATETKAQQKEKVVPAPEPKKEEHKKEEHKKEAPQPKKPEKPIQKPGFFKKFFGRKGD